MFHIVPTVVEVSGYSGLRHSVQRHLVQRHPGHPLSQHAKEVPELMLCMLQVDRFIVLKLFF